MSSEANGRELLRSAREVRQATTLEHRILYHVLHKGQFIRASENRDFAENVGGQTNMSVWQR